MGRVVYVFEVQTKGSIDSLILNLLKAVNNPAVQAVIAVSDAGQIEKIRKHAAGVQGLKDRLKYWDYQRVLEVHDALESVNAEINSLGLVPTITW
jgi:tRNA(Phe) wybutosine-synthesizing methylase Tyw3